jgi:hypothetical protein
MDRFAKHIRGRRREDGNTYWRTVEATDHMIETGEAKQKLERVLAAVHNQGPSVCLEVSEGGSLPMESDHVIRL